MAVKEEKGGGMNSRKRTQIIPEGREIVVGVRWRRPWLLLKPNPFLLVRNTITKVRQSFPFSPSSPLPPITLPMKKMRKKKKKKRKKTVPKGGNLCMIDKQAIERDLSSQKEDLLKSLFKCTSVNRKSTEGPCNDGGPL